jgi:hypothetical protein
MPHAARVAWAGRPALWIDGQTAQMFPDGNPTCGPSGIVWTARHGCPCQTMPDGPGRSSLCQTGRIGCNACAMISWPWARLFD